ncbi:hypothetical protein SLS58_006678 [Diplodia intermedia]|uniref:Uncharacterized protein n=1 Tax=Diplodia intermedia TaxID=856260 RepID=A0ABR3TMJ7_9PEZI
MSTVLSAILYILLFQPYVLAHEDFESRNLQTIQNIYNLTVYPNFLPIIANGSAAVPPGLFDQNATGRITPLGNFTGFEDSIEYFFALAPTPQGASGRAIYAAEVVEFTSGCPEVAASVVYLKIGQVDPVSGGLINGSGTTTAKQVAFWNFDDDGQVLRYDAWLPNLQRWNSILLGADFDDPPAQDAFRQTLCPAVQQRCTGPNQQYDSVKDCAADLAAKPFGNYDEAWGDNIACRTIHVILTQVRPEIHCPHVGPDGGNGPDNYKCVDIDYSTEYFADEKLYREPEGVPFTCPDKDYSY